MYQKVLVPVDGGPTAARGLAQAIIAAQKKEIAQFDTYLSKHGHPADKMSK